MGGAVCPGNLYTFFFFLYGGQDWINSTPTSHRDESCLSFINVILLIYPSHVQPRSFFPSWALSFAYKPLLRFPSLSFYFFILFYFFSFSLSLSLLSSLFSFLISVLPVPSSLYSLHGEPEATRAIAFKFSSEEKLKEEVRRRFRGRSQDRRRVYRRR